MAERFYVNCALGPGPFDLDGPEAHHLATVSRVRPGHVVSLFNGDGHEYPARVEQVHKRCVSLTILGVESPSRERAHQLLVAAPLPKGDRAAFLIEKLTELGVTTFIPLQTQRSVVHPREAKLDKLQRTVVEASKQCGRNVLMKVEPLKDWKSYCRDASLPTLRFVAHVGGEALAEANSQDRLVAVGPEGGFAEEEVDSARGSGWKVVGLGERILRVETAAIVMACRVGG